MHLKLRLASLVLILPLGFVACDQGGPGSGRGAGRIDSNTNWLTACADDNECDSGLQCECGICTLTCEEDSDCGNELASCATASSLPETCADDVTGVCVNRCQGQTDCYAGFACIGGACVPGTDGGLDQDVGLDTALSDAESDGSPSSDTEIADVPVNSDVQNDIELDAQEDGLGADAEEADAQVDPDVVSPNCSTPGAELCSDGIRFPENTLLRCNDGNLLDEVDTCALTCVIIDDGDDVCLDECPADRPFCGQNEGLRPGIIYRCNDADGLVEFEECTGACVQGPGEPPSCE